MTVLSRTSEYALRALIHLAQRVDDWPLTGKVIAEEAGIPPKYLSKVLGDLVRAGVLTSTRGLGGGFRMARPPEEISLLEVLAPFELFDLRRCPFGNKECGGKNPCLAHDQWKRVVDTEQNFFQNTSVYDVAVSRRKHGKGRSKARSRRRR